MTTPQRALVADLVLDSEALSQLARTRRDKRTNALHVALTAALEAGSEVYTTAAVLSEQYRNTRYANAVDAFLSANDAIQVTPTDRPLARQVGTILSLSGRGSKDHVDATVVATAAGRLDGATILTGDPEDMTALADGFDRITIAPLNDL